MQKVKIFLSNGSFASVLGCVLLVPSVISVFLFLGFTLHKSKTVDAARFYEIFWSGHNTPTTIPFYFGLMAIAGALLLSSKRKA